MIAWQADGPVTLAMAQGGDPAPARTLYSGGNAAYFVSGLADGVYTLTLSDEAGATASRLELTVAHQSLTRALWLIGLGAVVFLITVAVIVRGAHDE